MTPESLGHDASEALRDTVAHYRTLFNAMDEAYCVIEMLFDDAGTPTDYRFLEVNAAFIKMTGWPRAVGTRMRELAPNHEAHWFEIYGKVALTGEPIRFVQKADVLDARWFDLYACRLGGPGSRKVAVLFADITVRKQSEEALAAARAQLNEIIELAPAFMTVFRGPTFIVEVANDAGSPSCRWWRRLLCRFWSWTTTAMRSTAWPCCCS